MYTRRIEGKETTFGVSGTLWRDALVFFDRETESYWSQVNGTAINGEHEGKKLESIPSVVTTWGEWRRLHPDTRVARPSEESRDGSPYARYFVDPERLGVMGTENPDPRLPGKTPVLGILEGDARTAIPLDALLTRTVIQGEVGSTPLVAVAVSSRGGYAYDRRVDGEPLEFLDAGDGRMRDTATSSLWDFETGAAIEGHHRGENLRRLDSTQAFWFIWAGFNPDTAILD